MARSPIRSLARFTGVGGVRRLMRRYGWPVLLVPPLAAVTAAVGVQAGTSGADAPRPAAVESAASAPPADGRNLSCLANGSPQAIVVSISAQQAWMCEGPRQVYASPVTTGDVAAGDATPTGTWNVEDKQTDQTLVGPGYADFVRFWLPFFGDFGIHDASWQTMPFGDPAYRSQGSHGCIHLPSPAMAWLYDWAQVGTRVTVRS